MVPLKIVVSLVLLAALAGVALVWDAAIAPTVSSAEAFRQMEVHSDGVGDRLAAERRVVSQGLQVPGQILLGVAAVAASLLIWFGGRKPTAGQSDSLHTSRRFTMNRFFMLAVLVSLGLAGCAYDTPVYVEWGPNVTPFLTQLEGDQHQATINSEEMLKKNMLNVRRVQITYRWQPMGYGWNNGKFLPNERLILVDRSPVTREWTAGRESGTRAKDEAIWVESADSVGFSTGISITARILSNDDAVKFLYNYPAGKLDKIALSNRYKDDYDVKRVSLEDVIDTEVRARVQKVFAEEAARYKMDELRSKKNEIMKVVEEDIGTFFKSRGITITTIGMFGGLHYENPEIQKAIDKVFQAQQEKAVAQAEADAAKQRKEALKMAGEGEAQKKQEIAKGDAEAVKTVAEAKAFELEKLMSNPQAYLALKQLELQTRAMEVWDGRYPVFFVVGGEGASSMNMPNLLVTMPKMGDVPASPPNLNKVKHDAQKSSVKPAETPTTASIK